MYFSILGLGVILVENQLLTIGLLFFFAIIGGLISTKFKQPFVLGLIVVGAIIGPSALNLVNDPKMIDLVLEFGTILFLFVLGLEFSVKELFKMGIRGVLIAFFKMGIMFFLGYFLMAVIGMDPVTAVFIAVIVSFSSTMISMNILKQRGLMKRKEIPLLLTILIMEDIVGVLILNFFSAAAKAGTSGVITSIENMLLSLTVLCIIYFLSSKFAERMVTWIRKNTAEEVLTFISLGLCAGFALLAFLLGLSPGVGAFLAGSVVANFRESKAFEQVTKPYSFMFTSLFFIAIGTLINFTAIGEVFLLVLCLLVIMILGVFLSVGLTGRIFANFNNENFVFASVAMMPIGVFSLLIARESLKFNLPIDLVTATSITLFILAIFTSIMVGKTTKLTTMMSSLFPTDYKRKRIVSTFSKYFYSLFEELTVENRFTRAFKKKSSSVLTRVIILVLLLITLAKLLRYIVNNTLVVYGLLILVFVSFIIFRIRVPIKDAFKFLAIVSSQMDGKGNVKRSKSILKNLLLSLVLILIGLFQPFTIFLFGLSNIFVLIGLFMVLLGLYFAKKTHKLIRSFSSEKKYSAYSYKKMNPKSFFKPNI